LIFSQEAFASNVADLVLSERKKKIQEAWGIRSSRAKEVGLAGRKGLRMEHFR
jgi:hypothetical protein